MGSTTAAYICRDATEQKSIKHRHVRQCESYDVTLLGL